MRTRSRQQWSRDCQTPRASAMALHPSLQPLPGSGAPASRCAFPRSLCAHPRCAPGLWMLYVGWSFFRVEMARWGSGTTVFSSKRTKSVPEQPAVWGQWDPIVWSQRFSVYCPDLRGRQSLGLFQSLLFSPHPSLSMVIKYTQKILFQP